MKIDKFKEKELINNLIHYLNKNNVMKLYKLIDYVVYKTNEEYYKKEIHFPINIDNANIDKVENECNFIKNIINKNDLNHRERSILLFIYSTFGDDGIKRLKNIMSKQKNYNKNITNVQIDSYIKKGKLYGISCKKIINMVGSNYCRGCERCPVQ
jgi:transcriptional regulator with AAA-type ATPase domain